MRPTARTKDVDVGHKGFDRSTFASVMRRAACIKRLANTYALDLSLGKMFGGVTRPAAEFVRSCGR
jgi:hypothetical protein